MEAQFSNRSRDGRGCFVTNYACVGLKSNLTIPEELIMSGKKLFMLIALAFAALVSVNASVISLQIIQHDSTQDEVRGTSYAIENAMFDFLFDKGFIVTNSPTAASFDEREDSVICNRGLADAKIGMCDVFIVLTADYKDSASQNPQGIFLSIINQVHWEMFDVSTGRSLAKGKSEVVGEVPFKKDNEHGVSQFVRDMAEDILVSLRR